MPFVFGEITTPKGRPCLLLEASGVNDRADGEALNAWIVPGARFHDGLVFSRSAKGSEFTADLRRYFPTMTGRYTAMVSVVTSPIVRAAVNMMVRLSPRNNHDFKMFTDDAAAFAWLDERGDEAGLPTA